MPRPVASIYLKRVSLIARASKAIHNAIVLLPDETVRERAYYRQTTASTDQQKQNVPDNKFRTILETQISVMVVIIRVSLDLLFSTMITKSEISLK